MVKGEEESNYSKGRHPKKGEINVKENKRKEKHKRREAAHEGK